MGRRISYPKPAEIGYHSIVTARALTAYRIEADGILFETGGWTLAAWRSGDDMFTVVKDDGETTERVFDSPRLAADHLMTLVSYAPEVACA
jgi:hypothetical protein